jgi:integrase
VLPPSRLTFGDVAEEYFAMAEGVVASGGMAPRTLGRYRQQYDSHIKPVLGRRRMHEIKTEHVAAIFSRQRKNGLSEWTLSGTKTVLSTIIGFARSRRYIASNPLDGLSKIERPKQLTKRDPRRLSEDEVRKLCAAATPRYRPVLVTLAWTGLRVSEALGLRWSDIDFEGKEVRVTFQLADDGTLKRLKTKTSSRSLPLLPVLAETLKEHRKEQFRLGIAGPDHLVFTTATGKPLDRHNVYNQGVLAAAEKAGLHPEGEQKLTTHDLRRTFISHLILGLNLDPVRVAKIAGHSNVSVTLNTYADEFDKALHRDDLMARIEEAGFGSV